jgi:hypothetical protein
MKTFKHFLKIKEQSLDLVEPDLNLDSYKKAKEKSIAIHASFGHHLDQKKDFRKLKRIHKSLKNKNKENKKEK